MLIRLCFLFRLGIFSASPEPGGMNSVMPAGAVNHADYSGFRSPRVHARAREIGLHLYKLKA